MAVDGELVTQEFTVTISPSWQELLDSLDRLWGVTAEATHSFDGLVAILKGRWKHPYGGPAKLCIDGREYHRRQRNRVKRRR